MRRDHRVHEWFSPDVQATVLQVLEAAESPLSPVLATPLQDHTAVALTSFLPVSLTL